MRRYFYAIMTLSIIAIGAALWFISTASFISYTLGTAMGVALTISVMRDLGKKAPHSKFALRLFYKITKYKATICHFRTETLPNNSTNATATVYNDAHEYADLMEILKGQMKLPAFQAKEATEHAISIAKDKPFEEKIRVALQYWGGGEDNTPKEA